MSNTVTLGHIQAAAKRKFAPVSIGLEDGSEVELRGLIRLGEKDREAVIKHSKALEILDGDSIDDLSDTDNQLLVDAMNEIIRILGGRDGMKLVREIDNELPVLLQVFETWSKESQLGEAEPSPN